MSDIDLERQVACVERELALRKRAYPRWVASNRMTQAKADAEIAQMTAVLATLKKLASPPQAALFTILSPRAAVTERGRSVDDASRCPSCAGTGTLVVGGRSGGGEPAPYGEMRCTACGGTGARTKSDDVAELPEKTS